MLTSPQIRYDGPVGKAALGRTWSNRLPAKQDTAGAFALTDGKATKPAKRAEGTSLSAKPTQAFAGNEDLTKTSGLLSKILPKKSAPQPVVPSATGSALDRPIEDMLRQHYGLDNNYKLHSGTTLGDLNADDLDLIENIFSLEDIYGTNLPADKTPNRHAYGKMTFGELDALVRQSPKRFSLLPKKANITNTSAAAIRLIVKNAGMDEAARYVAGESHPWRAALRTGLLSALASGALGGIAASNYPRGDVPASMGISAGVGGLLGAVGGGLGEYFGHKNEVAAAKNKLEQYAVCDERIPPFVKVEPSTPVRDALVAALMGGGLSALVTARLNRRSNNALPMALAAGGAGALLSGAGTYLTSNRRRTDEIDKARRLGNTVARGRGVQDAYISIPDGDRTKLEIIRDEDPSLASEEQLMKEWKAEERKAKKSKKPMKKESRAAVNFILKNAGAELTPEEVEAAKYEMPRSFLWLKWKGYGVDAMGQKLKPEYFKKDFKPGMMIRTKPTSEAAADPMKRYQKEALDAPLGTMFY